MLNELVVLEQGMRRAGMEIVPRHPDIKSVINIPTLLVRFAAAGQISSMRPVPREFKLWTLRDGQKNSFPFIQTKIPLLRLEDVTSKVLLDKKNPNRQRDLLSTLENSSVSDAAYAAWPEPALIRRLSERRGALVKAVDENGAVLIAAIDGFLAAVDPSCGGDSGIMIRAIVNGLRGNLQETSSADWLDVALAILVSGTGAIFVDADSPSHSAADPAVVQDVSTALASPAAASGAVGICAITGLSDVLVDSKFPQPNLPVIGQTWLYARNGATPSNRRYARNSAEAMPVSNRAVMQLAGALTALTAPELKNVTWRSIAGEIPKQADLLIALIDKSPTVALTDILASDPDDIEMGNIDAVESNADSIAAFETRCTRAILSVEAAVSGDFRRTPVRVMVIRQLDPANRKVLHSTIVTVAGLYDAAMAWSEGERNVPEWLRLPVFVHGYKTPIPGSAPHVAPLSIPRFTRWLYTHGGSDRQETVGMTAAESLSLFLEDPGTHNGQRRVKRLLGLILARRGSLLVRTSSEVRRDNAREIPSRDRTEALMTVSILGILLHKLGRTKEYDYMKGTGFKLGQLLASLDVVHIGYCAERRGGDTPPSLLGNQVLSIAQRDPQKAMSILLQRWRPYKGWADQMERRPDRVNAMIKAKPPAGWDVRKALRCAREIAPLAGTIAKEMHALSTPLDDAFRAELLLGYMAGLPPAKKNDETPDHDSTEMED